MLTTTDTNGQTITFGSDLVSYHGSLTDQHANYLVHDVCDCRECDELPLEQITHMVLVPAGRYVAKTGTRDLHHVQPASVTRIGPAL